MKRILSALRDVWVAVGVVLVLIVVIEAVPNAWKSFWGSVKYEHGRKPDYRSGAEGYAGLDWPVPYFIEYWRDVKTDWAPYVQWRHRPLSGKYFTFDEEGHRHTWNAPRAADGTVPMRVFTFGGSTMMGFGARDDHTIPSYLARRLADSPYHVEVTNFGQGGYVNTQEVILLIEELKRGNIPNLVIFYDGVNEAGSAEQTGRAGEPMNEIHRMKEFNLTNIDRRLDLVRETVASLMPRIMRRADKAAGLLGLKPPPVRPVAEDMIGPLAGEAVRIYAENVEIVRMLGKKYGFEALFFWQPVVFSKKRLSPHEARYRNDGGWEPLYEAVYLRRRENAYLAGLPEAVDISGIFDDRPEGYFIDFCHLTEQGNDLVAEAMLPHVTGVLARMRR